MIGIKHLKCLSAVNSMRAVHQLTPAAFPGSHCPMHTALSLAVRINGVSSLVIGTAECGYYSRNIPLTTPHAKKDIYWSYLLNGKEVVFGFRGGLIDAIKQMDRAGARVILLLSTCVPELIGEDIESICHEVQPQVTARLLPIPLGNFKCGGYQPGYWKTLLSMGSLVEKVRTKSNTVNILGRSAEEDHAPPPAILTLLQRHGVPLRFLAPDASLDDFLCAGDARLGISLSPFMNPLGERMAQEHGIPLVSLHDIYSAAEIEAAYAQLERYLNLNITQETADAGKKAKAAQKAAAARLNRTHYISANIGALQALPLSAYLAELGMSPIMIHMEEFYPSDTRWKERLTEKGQNPILCLMLNEQADKPVIQALHPDIVLGDWAGRSDAKTPDVPLLDLYGQAGYERTSLLLERLTSALPAQKERAANGTV